MSLAELTITEARARLRAGDISSVELTQACLDRIEALEDKVKAYLAVTPALALEMAEVADQRRAVGEDGPLLGIPLAIKDVIALKGVPTTCGSRILEGFIPPFTATAVQKLLDAGARAM